MKKISPGIYESNEYYHINIRVNTPYLSSQTYKIRKYKPLKDIIERRKQVTKIWRMAKKESTIENDKIWELENDYINGNGKNKFWNL